ncbi:ribosomal protein S6--L-glutamate ligase/gamma-F420-2:alpha-L-glutamate ligase [Halolactibacillus halophilus]|uniref:Ribosomal protein S6--L-glutamate ligase/gamma-F420-2:alpha-L-glutamate ligase n=1 Tax=Halolactibacillus halophilus TaxID=306540 RepID=A0A1I5REK6_9BACI|nr:RimK family alpha-L-glutamate ligase [Halolactibacillus halophilus]GEM02172.1 hypothetical protein HHA03_17040 [Halolactibacillus halophilus]SFP56810.1 ribosomal protein S6--L-glutamate ligase/gamma-F420-2:alpha-L-glutamate ligase [Halolactibacillus halophilus]
MKGWLIHNGSLQTEKFKHIHARYLNQAKKQGIGLTLKRNDEVLVLLSQTHQPLTKLNIDFILFLDKDVLLAKQLEACGLPVFNSSEAIEQCDNKGLMHHILATKGIRQPKTIVAPLIFQTGQTFPVAFLDQVAKTLGFPLIVKKSFGSFGDGVYLVDSMTELKHHSEALKYTPHLYQQYIASSHGRDLRVHVVGDHVIATMMRRSEIDFRANVTNGGKMFVVDVPETFKDLARKATNALGLDFSGVDLLFDETNEPIVCEVNSNAHIENIYQTTGIDVSEAILTYIISRVHDMNS